MEWMAIGILVALVALGIPIYLGIFTAVIIIALYVMGVQPMVMASIMFAKVNMFILLAVPFFLMAGYFIAYGGTAKALLGLLNAYMRHIPGGPAYVIIVACIVFAAMSSSSMAAVAGFAPIMLPMMAAMGYDRKFSIGLLLVGSTLGPMIPPSVMLIMYGYIAEESVRDLYSAAFIPGFTVAALLFVTVFIYTLRGNYKRQPPASWGERLRATRTGFWVIIMPVIVMVPIYAGWVTPTEAGAVCAAYAFFLGTIVYRELKLPSILVSLRTCVRLISMIFIIVMAAFLLNWTLVYLRIPFDLSEAVIDLDLGKNLFLLVCILMFLLMGMILDPVAIILIGVILLLPTVKELGVDPIQYGILVTKITGIAGITPPYGMLLFLAVGLLNEPFQLIMKGCAIFLPAVIIAALMIAYIPDLSLWLVNYLH